MSQRETIVVALGGNALQRNGKATAEAQIRVADETARKLVPLVRQGYRLVIVHGNGPQVGNIVLHEEAINTPSVPTLPLDTCVAMSQGSIGFWLQQSMIDEFTKQRMPSTAATMITLILLLLIQVSQSARSIARLRLESSLRRADLSSRRMLAEAGVG